MGQARVARNRLPGRLIVGRSFESVRMAVKEVSARWLKASKALKKEDQIYGQRLAEMAKKHSSEAFYALDDPLEAAVFSVLVELVKELDETKDKAAN
jgi:hypothetical protein